jgi:hypothetical protein
MEVTMPWTEITRPKYIETAFRDESGRLLLSRTAVSDAVRQDLEFPALRGLDPARTIDTLWRHTGNFLDAFTPAECANFFHHAGYQHSL